MVLLRGCAGDGKRLILRLLHYRSGWQQRICARNVLSDLGAHERLVDAADVWVHHRRRVAGTGLDGTRPDDLGSRAAATSETTKVIVGIATGLILDVY